MRTLLVLAAFALMAAVSPLASAGTVTVDGPSGPAHTDVGVCWDLRNIWNGGVYLCDKPSLFRLEPQA